MSTSVFNTERRRFGLVLRSQVSPAARHVFKTKSVLAASHVGTVGKLSDIVSLRPTGPTIPTSFAIQTALRRMQRLGSCVAASPLQTFWISSAIFQSELEAGFARIAGWRCAE